MVALRRLTKRSKSHAAPAIANAHVNPSPATWTPSPEFFKFRNPPALAPYQYAPKLNPRNQLSQTPHHDVTQHWIQLHLEPIPRPMVGKAAAAAAAATTTTTTHNNICVEVGQGEAKCIGLKELKWGFGNVSQFPESRARGISSAAKFASQQGSDLPPFGRLEFLRPSFVRPHLAWIKLALPATTHGNRNCTHASIPFACDFMPRQIFYYFHSHAFLMT